MLLDEKAWLINPFALANLSDDEISNQITKLANEYIQNADVPLDIEHNLELLSDIMYLYGEMTSRFLERKEDLKLENDTGELLETHRLRAEWSNTRTEKAPNISYFEALAKNKFKAERKKELNANSFYIRFKCASEGMGHRLNVLKRKLDSIKYEVGA